MSEFKSDLLQFLFCRHLILWRAALVLTRGSLVCKNMWSLYWCQSPVFLDCASGKRPDTIPIWFSSLTSFGHIRQCFADLACMRLWSEHLFNSSCSGLKACKMVVWLPCISTFQSLSVSYQPQPSTNSWYLYAAQFWSEPSAVLNFCQLHVLSVSSSMPGGRSDDTKIFNYPYLKSEWWDSSFTSDIWSPTWSSCTMRYYDESLPLEFLVSHRAYCLMAMLGICLDLWVPQHEFHLICLQCVGLLQCWAFIWWSLLSSFGLTSLCEDPLNSY